MPLLQIGSAWQITVDLNNFQFKIYMRLYTLMLVALTFSIISGCGNDHAGTSINKRNMDFNEEWRFFKGDPIGASSVIFDDSQWRLLNLPHDWSIEDLHKQDSLHTGPFYIKSVGGISTGFTVGGTGWYRKRFTLNRNDENRRAIIHFDGVYMESEVWVNGQKVGFHPYGYTPFYYDITEFLQPIGAENVIAVKVTNEGANSRWYSGSGIYRPVALSLVDPVHVDVWGMYITTEQVLKDLATIKIMLTLRNKSAIARSIDIHMKVISNQTEILYNVSENHKINASGSTEIASSLEIEHPQLWSLEQPHVYTLEITLRNEHVVLDQYSDQFGIRTLDFSAEQGFLLNGKEVLLKGACLHHDHGLLGAAAFPRAEYRKVEIMKSNGFNAIRTSHNPPSEAFLDACDQLGMLVIDESFDMWLRPKNPNDYHRFFEDWWQRDLEAMIRRDRNHPSIMIWSIGNEINERADSIGLAIAREMTAYVHKMDQSRPVTQAVCSFWEHPDKEWQDAQPVFEIMDIGSYNYQWRKYEIDHQNFPARIMIGTESFALEAFENWNQVIKNPWVIGDFVWTGMDYLGEAAIGYSAYVAEGAEFDKGWPWFNAWCGDIDIIGNKKAQSYYRAVVWDRSRLELLVHSPIPPGEEEVISRWGWPDEQSCWNWPGSEGQKLDVTVYSSYPEVRLYLNDRLIGKQDLHSEDQYKAHFLVPYETGTLKAEGLSHAEVLESKILTTTGKPAGIALYPERAEVLSVNNELVFIKTEIVDRKGKHVPNAEEAVTISLDGPASLLAAGNGAPNKVSSFKNPTFKTYRGRGLIILRLTGAPGVVDVQAVSGNLANARTQISVL